MENELTAKRRLSPPMIIVAGVLGLLVVGAVVTNRSRSGAPVSTAGATAAASVPSTPAPPPAPVGGKWVYSSKKDEMRGTTAHYADLDSDNTLSFAPPYQDGKATLTVRKGLEDGTVILITITGQSTCHSLGHTFVAVKFDDGPVQRIQCGDATDGSTGVIFLRGASKLIPRLRSAKRFMVEAEFFQDGRRQMVFDVQGLQWPPKEP